jgi:hypothetical protein
MADDPVVQMVRDPDFAKMPVSEQQKALAAHDPDFAKMDAPNISAFVQAHQARAIPSPFVPGDIQTMKGSPIYNVNRLGSQALPYASMGAAVSGAMARGQTPNFPQQVQQEASQNAGYAPEIGGAMGMPLGPAGMAAGAGLGNIAESRMRGQPSNLTGALTEAAATYAGGKAAELVPAAFRKLIGASPARIAELQGLFPKEQALEQSVNQAEEGSRAAFHAAYDRLGIDSAPTNVANARNLANNAADELAKFTGKPRPLSKVAGMARPSESLLVGDDPSTILDQLASWDQIPFRDAQRFQTNIEQYIAKSHPPAEVYNALKQVSRSLDAAKATTALREGGQPMLDQLQAADGIFKQHAADFWNKGAPLKDYLPITKGGQVISGQEGATINRLLEATNQSRALEALQRRGVPTDDIRQILRQGPEAAKQTVQQAVTLKNFGQQAMTAPARQALVGKGARYALGGGLTADLIYRLATKK